MASLWTWFQVPKHSQYRSDRSYPLRYPIVRSQHCRARVGQAEEQHPEEEEKVKGILMNETRTFSLFAWLCVYTDLCRVIRASEVRGKEAEREFVDSLFQPTFALLPNSSLKPHLHFQIIPRCRSNSCITNPGTFTLKTT